MYDFEAPLRITNKVNRTGTRDLILIDYENEELITESYNQNCPKVRYITTKVKINLKLHHFRLISAITLVFENALPA